MKYLIKFSYDGSKFNGFQRLKDNDSVQERLEEALSLINKGKVVIKGAGRTDRGVHAMNQAAHFSLDVDVPPKRLIHAINSLVGDYIHVNDCCFVDEDFHARFSVKKKMYIYKIYLGKYNPLLYDYYEFIDQKLDVEAMKSCANIFMGIHNFKNFVAGKRDNYEAIIYDIAVTFNDDYLEIAFLGKSFYRYMVRHLVGALIDVGLHKRDIGYIEEALTNYEKEMAISVASPRGLYLEDVFY